ncbi:hypothetical protein OA179_00405 [Candidatus Pelagibacter sp.]|nr:hypothetical protein [Candidatus Pelagibacter sp.]
MTKKNIAIFISSEGYGHLVRQRALISELLKYKKRIKITVFTSKNISILRKKFKKKISYVKIKKTLETSKSIDGKLNIKKTKKNFAMWYENKNDWIKSYQNTIKNYDLIISDFMPEVFELANKAGKIAFGMAHFTWDWFYKALYGKDKIYFELLKTIKMSKKIYFPPFTNEKIVKNLKSKVVNINFILSEFGNKKKEGKIYKCLIMDNGNRTMTKLIENTLIYLKKLKDISFILRTDFLSRKSKKIISSSKNMTGIKGLKETHQNIVYADFIIARGGFNTISECLVLKKPSLLFNETGNPEIKENLKIMQMKKYCGLIKHSNFGNKIKKRIDTFISKEFDKIRINLHKKKYASNGAAQAAKNIIGYI